jgi:hypothetical protein
MGTGPNVTPYYVNLCKLAVCTISEVAFLSRPSVEMIKPCDDTRHADQEQTTSPEAAFPSFKPTGG